MIQNLVAACDVSKRNTHRSSNQSVQLNTSQVPSGSWISLWLGEVPNPSTSIAQTLRHAGDISSSSTHSVQPNRNIIVSFGGIKYVFHSQNPTTPPKNAVLST